ncbi:MAG: RNA polymerase sigma factor [Thermoanaerobaculia bacterium]
MSQPEIRELLRRCAAGGDDAAWREFLDLFGAALAAGVRRVARQAGLPGDPASREELLQEAYCRLLANDGRILRDCRADTAPAVAAYLRRVAESTAVDRLRLLAAAKRGRHLLVRLHEADRGCWRGGFVAEAPGPEARLLARERRRRAFTRCRRLVGGRSPGRDLAVLYLAYSRGLNSREIARRLGGGLTAARVDSLMHRLRRRLARGGIRIPRR